MQLKSSNSYLFVLINSTLIFVIANILATTLHELGHYVAAQYMQAQNVVLHHNYASYSFKGLSVSVYRMIIVNAAGPLVSLLIGAFFHLFSSWKLKKDLVFLFYNYMAYFGYIGFFGYIMIAPFFDEGDTGFIMQALHFPVWAVVIVALTGLVILYKLSAKLTRNFVSMSPAEALESDHARAVFMYILILIPVFLGILFTTLLNLPVVSLLSLLAPILGPLTILWTFNLAIRKDYIGLISNDDFSSINKPSYVTIVILIAVVVMNRMLVDGYPFAF